VTTYIAWILLALLALGQPAVRGPAMAPSEVLGVHASPDDHSLEGKTYVALGDSISAGRYATTQAQTFPFVVAAGLGMNLDLIARSGTKAAWGVQQIPAVNAAHPALVTIELGTNDVGFNTPGDAFTSQYDEIVSSVSGPNSRVLCIGSWLPSPSFDDIIRTACEKHGGTFVSLDGFYAAVDFHAPDGGSSYLGRTDWFHPGNQGHAAIAAAIIAALGAGPPPVIGPTPSASPASDVLRARPS
jgi:lysophospholipase L1-like esterase